MVFDMKDMNPKTKAPRFYLLLGFWAFSGAAFFNL